MEVVDDAVETVEVSEEEILDEFEMAFEALEEAESQNPEEYTSLLKHERVDDKALKIKEQCTYRLAKLHTQSKNYNEVMSLLKSNADFFGLIPKARTAKIVRSILDIVATVPDSADVQIQLCGDVAAWCTAEKRTFLRQRIEARLSALLLSKQKVNEALAMVNSLLKELKKLDDKQMLTEVHLTESRIYHVMQNIAKSKASLTACRTSANAIYVTPLLQAELDEMSGVLHCEEGDTPTAYSYFLEAFDGFDTSKVPARALTCIQYMALCKILISSGTVSSHQTGRLTTSQDVNHLYSTKQGVTYAEFPSSQAMKAIAKAVNSRSLSLFQTAVAVHSEVLHSDPLVAHHLDELYERMLENNLLKIIQPYSVVEISHIVSKIQLPTAQVEKKLSQMILDNKLSGTLEQGLGHLICYKPAGDDVAFDHALDIVGNMGEAVDVLFTRAKSFTKGAVVPVEKVKDPSDTAANKPALATGGN